MLRPLSADQRVAMERRWRAGTRPRKPQMACDIGLFSDDADQLDLIEMFQDPTNEDE